MNTAFKPKNMNFLNLLISWFNSLFAAPSIKPVSVNYHFTRICNYKCGFCFHTSKTSNQANLTNAKFALKKLADAGMKKLNFAGGEPLLYPKFVGDLAKYCKQELQIESVSIVSNGSKAKSWFFDKYGKYIDVFAVSVDSFDEDTNIEIGRGTGNHLSNLEFIKSQCLNHSIKFKINTVVNSLNWNQDMTKEIELLNPYRWKCFQVLIIDTENNGTKSLRDANYFKIDSESFRFFIDRHAALNPIAESNELMRNSYLVLDENLCFLDSSDGKKASKSLLDCSVEECLKDANWDHESFVNRGGIYDWKKNDAVCEEDWRFLSFLTFF